MGAEEMDTLRFHFRLRWFNVSIADWSDKNHQPESALLPSYRSLDAVISAMVIMAGGCVVTAELGILIYGPESCSAYQNIVKEKAQN
jgi:hypothetical protein